MPDDPQINPRTHLEAIEAALRELLSLEPRTKAPAPLPHQFVGTVVDNTIGLLIAPLNALDGGHRTITFSATHNWMSLMQGVHRSFFSSIHLAAEAGLVGLCKERQVPPRSRLQAAMLGALARIEAGAGHIPAAHRAIKDLRALLRTYRPGFDDHLEGVLSTVNLSEETKKTWRRFFRALSIVRNKTSHSDPTLTEDEQSRLRGGGFGVMVSQTGDLVANPRMYFQVAGFTLDFLDLVSHDAHVKNRSTG